MTRDHGLSLSVPLKPMLSIAFVNFLFLLLLLLVFFSFFAQPAGYEIRMPGHGLGHEPAETHVTVRITGENVLYFNDRVVTLNELKRGLLKAKAGRTEIYLHTDRGASMGRVADVWDMCRGLGNARVKIIALEGVK